MTYYTDTSLLVDIHQNEVAKSIQICPLCRLKGPWEVRAPRGKGSLEACRAQVRLVRRGRARLLHNRGTSTMSSPCIWNPWLLNMLRGLGCLVRFAPEGGYMAKQQRAHHSHGLRRCRQRHVVLSAACLHWRWRLRCFRQMLARNPNNVCPRHATSCSQPTTQYYTPGGAAPASCLGPFLGACFRRA